MGTIGYATFRYDTVEVENGLKHIAFVETLSILVLFGELFSLSFSECVILGSKRVLFDYFVEGDRGAGTRENRGGRWAGSGRRRSGMRESCEGGRRMRDIKFFNDFLVPF